MPTAYTLIRRSLLLCGVVNQAEALPAGDAQDGYDALNAMLQLWRLEGLLAYDIVRIVFALVPGQQDYTVGPGGHWDTTALFGATTARPVQIEALGLVDATQTPALEVPMDPLSQGAYQSLHLKGLTSAWPTHWQYSATVPLGSVFVWPVPTVGYQVAAYLWRSLATWPALHTDLTLPDGAEEALTYNLARRLAPTYGVQLLPDVVQLAVEAKALLMRINSTSEEKTLDDRVPGSPAHRQTFNWLTGSVE